MLKKGAESDAEPIGLCDDGTTRENIVIEFFDFIENADTALPGEPEFPPQPAFHFLRQRLPFGEKLSCAGDFKSHQVSKLVVSRSAFRVAQVGQSKTCHVFLRQIYPVL